VARSQRPVVGTECVAWTFSVSALRDDFHPEESDVDLLVEFAPMEGYARVDAYFGLLEDLRDILGRKVDLVMSGAVKNRYIVRDIEKTKQMLYAA